jgi:hypothetical protein
VGNGIPNLIPPAIIGIVSKAAPAGLEHKTTTLPKKPFGGHELVSPAMGGVISGFPLGECGPLHLRLIIIIRRHVPRNRRVARLLIRGLLLHGRVFTKGVVTSSSHRVPVIVVPLRWIVPRSWRTPWTPWVVP